MKKEEILNGIAFIIGAITVLGAVILKDNIIMAGIVAGCGACLYGLIKAINKTSYGYILISVGLGLASSLALYKFGIFDRPDALTFMICISTFVLMLVTFIFDYINRKDMHKIYSLKCEAEVIDLVKNPNTKKDYFQIIYGYVIDDKYYTVGSLNYVNKFIPRLGNKLTIYVDPSDHANVYFEKDIKDKIYDSALGLFLMIASLIILITLFV